MAKNLPYRKHSEAKTSRQIERYMKGVSHHLRIDILGYVGDHEGASLEQITEALAGNFKTVGHHVTKLYAAGLINKQYAGHSVQHSLSPYGQKVLKFMDSF